MNYKFFAIFFYQDKNILMITQKISECHSFCHISPREGGGKRELANITKYAGFLNLP